MTIRGWKTKFNEIRKDFGYSEKEDLISAKKLNFLLKRKNSRKQIQNIIRGKTVFVIGAGPSLSKSLKYIKKSKNVTKIVADGAVRALLEKNIKPDILVTDLDGDLKSIKKIGKTKIQIIVHAHGDNSNRLEIVKELSNVIGTTQTREFGKLENLELKQMVDLDKSEFFILACLAVPTLFFGFYPDPLINTIEVSISDVIREYNMNTITN